MRKTSLHPSDEVRFEQELAALEPRQDYQAAYDFISRWRFAKSFSRIEAEGYATDSKVVDGYFVLLRLLLACAAREQLKELLGVNAYNELDIVDPALARRVREDLYGDGTTRFAKAMQKPNTARAHRQLGPFWLGEDDDINMVAFAIRHGAAHGSLTPSGIQLDKDGKKQVIVDLTDAVLGDSDKRFTAWVSEEISRRSKSASTPG